MIQLLRVRQLMEQDVSNYRFRQKQETEIQTYDPARRTTCPSRPL
jgi:hypothetical protein